MDQTVKNLPPMWETRVWSLGQEDTQEKGMETNSSVLAWRIPRTEEPWGLQSTGLQTVKHDWVTNTGHTNKSYPEKTETYGHSWFLEYGL